MKMKQITAAPVDATELLNRLKMVAKQLASHPFDLEWDMTWANAQKANVQAIVDRHNQHQDDDEFQPVDEGELWLDQLPVVFKRLAYTSFFEVKQEVEHMEREYQAHQSERMADEAGFRHDSQFVESSDWLTAMELQARYAIALSHFELVALNKIDTMVNMLDRFTGDWRDASVIDDQPVLCEAMQNGLRGLIPMLLLTVKKVA